MKQNHINLYQIHITFYVGNAYVGCFINLHVSHLTEIIIIVLFYVFFCIRDILIILQFIVDVRSNRSPGYFFLSFFTKIGHPPPSKNGSLKQSIYEQFLENHIFVIIIAS